jgi:secreted trypsin-like serine protease
MDGCGGSLIAPGVVLSAAHCGDYDGYAVMVGGYERGEITDGAVSRTVAETRFHPNYNGNTEENDFMLLRLESPVTMSSNVELALNDDFGIPQNNQYLTVLGLGSLEEGGDSPNFLRDVVVQAVDTNECNVGSVYGGDVNGDSMFCAGVDEGGKDSCQGDSGGPIVVRQSDNTHVQVGVVSWGIGCARPGIPGVYARVSSAHDWIKAVVCDEWNESASFCDGDSGGGGDGGGDGGDPPSCNGDLLKLELETDDYASDTEILLVTRTEEFLWNEWGFRNNRRYEFFACIESSECATLNIFDSYGDG